MHRHSIHPAPPLDRGHCTGVIGMPEINTLRSLKIMADGRYVAESCRIAVEGKTSMTCLPDVWQIAIYSCTDQDLAILRRASQVDILGQAGSVLVSGAPADIIRTVLDTSVVTTLFFMEGEAFWRSAINLSIRAGATARQTVERLIAPSKTALAAFPETTLSFQRGQSWFGRAADAVDDIVKAIHCRAYTIQNALYVVQKGMASVRATLKESAVLDTPSFMKDGVILRTDVTGLLCGEMVYADLPLVHGTFRLAAQTVTADNYSGAWQSMITLMDEEAMPLHEWEGCL